MKRFLKWALDFLERKFPDRVEVTAERYRALEVSIQDTSAEVAKLHDRIESLEMNLKNLNVAVGFSVPKMGVLER